MSQTNRLNFIYFISNDGQRSGFSLSDVLKWQSSKDHITAGDINKAELGEEGNDVGQHLFFSPFKMAETIFDSPGNF